MSGITMNQASGEKATNQPVIATKQSYQPVGEYYQCKHDDATSVTSTTVTYKYSSRSTCAQVVATLIQNWLLFSVGMEIAITTLVLGALHKHSEEKLCMDDAQASWYASLPPLVRPIASLASGFFQEYFGRKKSAVLVNIPMIAAWLLLYFADSVHALYAGSIIMGLSRGLYEAPVHSYIGEIAEPRIRGILSSTLVCGVTVGISFTFIIGNYVDWRGVALIGSAVPVVAFIFMTQIPESPTWLIKRNRLEDAQKSLAWLRGWVEPEEVQNEFDALVEYVKIKEISGTIQENVEGRPLEERNSSSLKAELRKITDKKVLRPLRLVMSVLLINYATALEGFSGYWIGILNGYKLPFDSKKILMFNPLFFLAGTLSNVIFLRRFGKRKIALLSNGVAAPIILLLGVYSSHFTWFNQIPGLFWTPIVLSIVLDIFCGLSVIPLPWQLVSEVFPPEGRGAASGISSTWAHFVLFVSSKSFLYLRAWITLSGVLYLYGVVAILGWLHHYYFLPETEGKSLAQIESYFTKNHDRKEKFSIGKSV